jgi:hypothetical protein
MFIVFFLDSIWCTHPTDCWSQTWWYAVAGHSTAAATVATVTAAVHSSLSGQDKGKKALAKDPESCASPTSWFVADDRVLGVRYFVLQGSDNFDHWKMNLTFDPVVFEDPELGVKVSAKVPAKALFIGWGVMWEVWVAMVEVQVHASTLGIGKMICRCGDTKLLPISPILYTGHIFKCIRCEVCHMHM